MQPLGVGSRKEKATKSKDFPAERLDIGRKEE